MATEKTTRVLALTLCAALSWSYVTASDDGLIPLEEAIVQETATITEETTSEETTIAEMTEKEKWSFVKKAIVDKTEEEKSKLFSNIIIGSLIGGATLGIPFLAMAGITKLLPPREQVVTIRTANNQNVQVKNLKPLFRGQRVDNDQYIHITRPGIHDLSPAGLFTAMGGTSGLLGAFLGGLVGLENFISKRRIHFAHYVTNWEDYKDKTPQELHPIFEESYQMYQKLSELQDFQQEAPSPPQNLLIVYLEKLFTKKYEVVKQLIEAQNL